MDLGRICFFFYRVDVSSPGGRIRNAWPAIHQTCHQNSQKHIKLAPKPSCVVLIRAYKWSEFASSWLHSSHWQFSSKQSCLKVALHLKRMKKVKNKSIGKYFYLIGFHKFFIIIACSAQSQQIPRCAFHPCFPLIVI